MPEQEGGIRGHCVCGAQVWHVQRPDQLPRPSETIICPACERDNSRRPSLAWLLKFYVARLKKRRRYFGLVRMWGLPYIELWTWKPLRWDQWGQHPWGRFQWRFRRPLVQWTRVTYPVPFWRFRAYPKQWREAKRLGELAYQRVKREGASDVVRPGAPGAP